MDDFAKIAFDLSKVRKINGGHFVHHQKTRIMPKYKLTNKLTDFEMQNIPHSIVILRQTIIVQTK